MLAYKIPGQLTDYSCDLLFEYVSKLPEGAEILECGCLLGKSTTAILEGCEKKYLDVVDTWDEGLIEWIMENNIPSLHTTERELLIESLEAATVNFQNAWHNNVKKHPNYKSLRKAIKGNSLDVEKRDYDLVFIDDCHEYEHLLEELKMFGHNPLVIIDDNQLDEVCQAVHDYCFKNEKSFIFKNKFLVIENGY